MHKRTSLDQIEITRSGTIQLRFITEVVDDDGIVVGSEYHRAACPPGGDVDAHMAAVNRHLIDDLRCTPVEAADVARIKELASVAWAKELRDGSAPKRQQGQELLTSGAGAHL